MKTAIIFNDYEQLYYFVVDGDLSHLHGVIVNSVDSDPKLQDEVCNLIYDAKTGEALLSDVELAEFVKAVRDNSAVIEIGFLP